MLDEVIRIAKKASDEIVYMYNLNAVEVSFKDDNSPITNADFMANEMIESGLKTLTPNIPILSEEGASVDYDVRKDWGEYWCVDPLDGTKGFVNRDAKFSVNIALMRQNRPVLGVIVDCLSGRVFYAKQNEGAFMWENGKVVKLQVRRDFEKAVVSSHFASQLLDAELKKFGVKQKISMGSSVKFCEVALGNAGLYLRIGNTMEWDVASADVILSEAGGGIYEYDMNFISA